MSNKVKLTVGIIGLAVMVSAYFIPMILESDKGLTVDALVSYIVAYFLGLSTDPKNK